MKTCYPSNMLKSIPFLILLFVLHFNAFSVPIGAPTNLNYSTSSSTLCYGIAGNSVTPTVNAGGGTITYSLSGNPTGVTINSTTGVISWTNTVAVGIYKMTVSASNGSPAIATTTYGITVNALPVIDTIVGNSNVCIGSTVQLSDSTSGGTWTSSNTYVGTINSSGLFIANAPGTSTIIYKATNAGGCFSSITKVITVINNPYAGTITGLSTFCTNNYDTLKAAASGIWILTNNSIATISSIGVVTGISNGNDTVVFTTTNSYGCVTTLTYPITILANPFLLDTIIGSPDVCVGTTIQLSNSTSGGAWSSSDNYVGSINATTGVLTGNAAGTTKVTYLVASSQGCTAQTTKVFTTINNPYAGTITGLSTFCTNNFDTLKAAASGVWTLNNNSIATISSSGVVTGISSGNDTVVFTTTNPYGCITTLTYPITILANPFSLDTIVGSPNVCVGSTIQLTNSTSGGVWFSSDNYVGNINTTTGVLTGNAAGTTKVTYLVTSSQGCTAQTTKVFTTVNDPYIGTLTGANSICGRIADTLKVTVNNGIWASLNNSVATVSSNGIVTGSSYGVDTVTYSLTNSYGCTSTLTKVISVGWTSSTTNVSVCSSALPYSWNGNSYNSAGIYTVHLTNSAGCDSAATLALTVKAASSSTTNASICTGGSYVFNGTAYTTSGTYVVHLTNKAGCDSAATLILTVSAYPVVAVITGTTNVCAGSTTQLSDSTTGGVWSSSNTSIATINSSGLVTGIAGGTATITYTVTNSSGCASFKTTTITVSTPVVLTCEAGLGNQYSISGITNCTVNACIGQNLWLSVNPNNIPGTPAVWTGPNGFYAPSINSNNDVLVSSAITPAQAGVYTATYTQGVCTSVANITVIANAVPTVDSVTGNNNICINSTSQLYDSTPGGVWSSGNSNYVSVSSSGLVTGLLAGNVWIGYTVTNASGCSTTKSTVVSVNTPFVFTCEGRADNNAAYATLPNCTMTVCQGSPLWLSVNPNFSNPPGATWTGPNGFSSPSINSNNDVLISSAITPAQAGVYTATYQGVCTSTGSIIIVVNPLPVVDTIVGTANMCPGSTVAFSDSTSGGVWSTSNSYYGTINASGIYTANYAGSPVITYTYTNAQGCTSSVSKSITIKTGPYMGSITGLGSICTGGTTKLTASSGTGVWASTNNAITTVTSTGIVTGISGGIDSISYTLTSPTGCTGTIYKTMIEASTSSVTTANICSGSSYTFNGTTYTTAGTYIAHLTNAVSCDSTATLVLTVKPTSTSTTNESICPSALPYLWNGNSYTATGTYVVHLTNAVGCDSAATLILTVNNLPSTPTVSVLQPVCGTNTGTITITAPVDSGYTYSINGINYQASPSFTSLVYGSYYVTAQNSSGCISLATNAVVNTAPKTINDFGYVSNQTTQPLSSNSFDFVTGASVTGDTYNWDFGDGTSSSVANPTKSYTNIGIYTVKLIAVSIGGCSDTSYQSVVVTPATKAMQTIPLCGSANPSIVKQTIIFPSSATDWSGANIKTMTVEKFDTTLGTLLGVKVINKGSFTTHNKVEITGNMAAGTKRLVNMQLTGTMNFYGPGFLYGIAPPAILDTFSSTGFDGIIDFGGTSGKDFGVQTMAMSDSTIFTSASILASYKGSGSVSLIAYTNTQFSASIPTGNDTMVVSTMAMDSAIILYYYCPASDTSITNASICSDALPYKWNGIAYNNGGTYNIHLNNSTGGDSVAILVLTIKATSTSTTTASICAGGSYTFNGTTYTISGTYIAHLTNAIGCDSSATLVLTVIQPVSVAAINGTTSLCAGSTGSTLSSATPGGIWSTSDSTIATINSSGVVTGIAAGSVTITYTVDNQGCSSSSVNQKVTVSVGVPSVAPLTGLSLICTGLTTTLSDVTSGGVWSSSNASIATVNDSGAVTGVTEGNATIFYTIFNGGCSATASTNFTVSCGVVTSGNNGGVESKSLGDIIGKRVYNKAKNGISSVINYNNMPKLETKQGMQEMSVGTNTLSLSSLMPDNSVLGTGYTTYITSPTDLTSFTNALDVFSQDFTVSQQNEAVAFATKTTGGVYGHTKPICDRLRYAELTDVQTVSINNLNLIQYRLIQDNGDVEYAISFSAGKNAGTDTIDIQSNWMTQDYVGQDTMYNFQLWAAEPLLTQNMAQNVLNRLQSIMPLQQITTTTLGAPSVYVRSCIRDGSNNMNLKINNTTGATSGYLVIADNPNEQSSSTITRTIPVSLTPNGIMETNISMKDYYEANVQLFVNGTQTDLVYTNDGSWSVDYDNQTKLNSFIISNDTITPDSSEFRLFRDIQVDATTSDYISVYRIIRGGGEPQDLSAFKAIKLNASCSGTGSIKITLLKASITNYNDQYTYRLPVNSNKEYVIDLKDFVSTASGNSINANDITTVVFSFENNDGGTAHIIGNLSDIRFTNDTVDLVDLTNGNMTVYPNPSNGNFVCKFTSTTTTTAVLRIIELGSGKQVYAQNINVIQGANAIPISWSPPFNGSNYFVVEIDDNSIRYGAQKVLIYKN